MDGVSGEMTGVIRYIPRRLSNPYGGRIRN